MNNRSNSIRVAAILVFTLAAVAGAAEYTWTPTAGGTAYDWNDAGNWGGSGFPNGTGDVANVNSDIDGNQTIRLRQDVTIGRLNIGDAAGAVTDYDFTIGNASGEDFVLTFDSGEEGAPAEIHVTNSERPSSTLRAPVTLNSDLLVDVAGTDITNRPLLRIDDVIAVNGRTVTFTNGLYGYAQVDITANGDFAGEGTVVNNSSSCVNLTGKKTFPGRIVASGKAAASNQSTFSLTGGGITNAAEFIINGYLTGSITREGGGIHSGSGSSHTENPGQRLTMNRITFNGGHLVAHGQPAVVGVANDWQMGLEWVRDEVAFLDFNTGYSYIAVDAAGNTLGTKVDVTTLERGAGASVYLFGVNDANRNFLAGNGAAHLVGAGGSAGSTTMSMVPWATVYDGGGYVSPAGFATYDAPNGFRALSLLTEYTASLAAGSDHNVSINTVALTTNATVNALRYTGGSSNMGAGNTLTVASGGLFFTGSGTIGASGNVDAGTLNFGGAEGVIWAISSQTPTIGAVITGTGGITKACTGTLTLTGDNAFSGTTHVGGGTLRVGAGTYASDLGSGDVHIHAGAVLQISTDNAIVNSASVEIYRAGLCTGRIELEAGRNETVKRLHLGGVPQGVGTFGSTASMAAHQNDLYFSGTGVLTTTQSAVPPPAGSVTMIL